MKNILFNLKAVQTGSYKAEVGAGAGAETNSSGSTTLHVRLLWSCPCVLVAVTIITN
jgi:hypothetical protein